MPDPAKYKMSFRPNIRFPTATCARALVESIQDEDAREECLEALDEGYCETTLLDEHLPSPDAEYVRQFIEGVEVVAIALGNHGGMVDVGLSIRVRETGPGKLEYLCGDALDCDFEEFAEGRRVATLKEMIRILKAAFDHQFSPYGWPQAAFSADPSQRLEPGHFCNVSSEFYPELSDWFHDFAREYEAAERTTSKGVADKS